MTTMSSVTATAPQSRAEETARWPALGAVVGPVLFMLAWFVLGLMRPGYSPVRQQLSDLAVGANGGLMTAAFVVGGLLLLAGVVGIFQGIREMDAAARWICTVLLALSPLGGIVVGAFNETQVVGHVTGAILAFQTPVIGFLVTGLVIRRSPRWRRIGNWLLLASPLTLALVFVFLQTGPPGAPLTPAGLGGLTERALVLEIHAWFVALGWLTFRRQES